MTSGLEINLVTLSRLEVDLVTSSRLEVKHATSLILTSGGQPDDLLRVEVNLATSQGWTAAPSKLALQVAKHFNGLILQLCTGVCAELF